MLNSFSLDPKTGDLTYNSNFKLNSLFTNEYIIENEAADADKPAELRDEFNLILCSRRTIRYQSSSARTDPARNIQ